MTETHNPQITVRLPGTQPLVHLRFYLDSNINIQMNYWSAEPTALDVTSSLFNYFEVNYFRLSAYINSQYTRRKTGYLEVPKLLSFFITFLEGG